MNTDGRMAGETPAARTGDAILHFIHVRLCPICGKNVFGLILLIAAMTHGAATETGPIQSQIDDCASKGGGTVSIHEGTHVTGSLFLKSHVTLNLEKGAIIKGSEDEEDYPTIDTRVAGIEMKHPAALVNAIDCTDVAIIGPGTIDGSGKHWWDIFWKTREERGRGVDFQVPRPRLICFTRCENVRVSDVHLENPAFWTLHILYSKNVEITGVTQRAPKKAASSDGIDIDSSSDVRITKCDISCDDDDIVVKSGRDADGLRVNKPSENITISDCTIGAGGGIAIGSETAGGIRHVLVKNCTFNGTGAAARVKSMPGRGGVVEDITFDGLTATDVKSVIDINMAWGGSDWKKFVDPKFIADMGARGTPVFRDIHLKNITAMNALSAGTLHGLPDSPLEGITFDNVKISAQRGMTVSNAPSLDFAGLKIDAREGLAIVER
jgi:exo-poly-alpha-galacturonosidase